MRKKCDVCGHRIESWDEVCPNCGNRINQDNKGMILNGSSEVYKNENVNDEPSQFGKIIRKFLKWIFRIVGVCALGIAIFFGLNWFITIGPDTEIIQDKVQIIEIETINTEYRVCLTKVSYKGEEMTIEIPMKYEEILQLCEGLYIDAEIEVTKHDDDDVSYEILSVELPDSDEDLQRYKEESKEDVGEFTIEKKNKDDEVANEDVIYELEEKNSENGYKLEEKKSGNALDAVDDFFNSFIQ